MRRITFIVPGKPIAQTRARVFVDRNTGKIRACTKAGPIQSFKEAARIQCSVAMEGGPMDGPIALTVRCVFPRNKGEMYKSKPMPRMWHTKTPDADNVIKGLKDALKHVAWRDDSQVCVEFIEKVIAAGNEQPHTVVTIESIEDLPPPMFD